MSKAKTSSPRLMAIRAVSEVLDEGLSLAESPSLQATSKDRDLSMARHLAYGVLRWLTALEWLANDLLSRPIRQRDRDIHRLILLGLYQLWQDETPPHAAIHETAECARHMGKAWAVGLVNAVLRRFDRERKASLDRLSLQEECFAHPLWMLHRFQHDWPDNWREVAQANNRQAPLWLRLNRVATDLESVTERLEDQGFEVHAHASAPEALRISPAVPVENLESFTAGLVSVQDPAAQLAAGLVHSEPGMRVLDACAAPGGKTCHLLENSPGIELTAIDISPGRIDLVRQNLQRLKLDCTLLTADAAEPDTWWDGQPFQRILLDAPCSSSGVIRRHPEIKHLRQAQDIDAVLAVQQRLLQQLWPLLDVGGILVYATCSVFSDENSLQVSRFLEEQRNADEQVIDAGWGLRQTTGRQIFPGEQDMDGFFYAVMRKIS